MDEKIYSLVHSDLHCNARRGLLTLPQGKLQTPVFMPVGTAATVKATRCEEIRELGFGIILSNTYHLYLRPGSKLIQEQGGLHAFMNWSGNILTDSGGYQIFSLSKLRKIREDGVEFRSHIDGSRHFLAPEDIVRVQCELGSDIQMVLDVCTGPEASLNEAKEAARLTAHWAKRAQVVWKEKRLREKYPGQLFGIVQGNFYEELRRRSASEITSLDLPGYALGGLSVGEPFEQFQHFTAFSTELLPADKPRYLMGIGTPEYILEAIEHGIDMFDCVFPTRLARNGSMFTPQGRLVIKNACYKRDNRPIMDDGPICGYSRSYLRHLFKADEMLGPMLASLHNLWFLKDLVDQAGQAIEKNQFLTFKKKFLEEYKRGISF